MNDQNSEKSESSLIKKLGLLTVIVTDLFGLTGAGIAVGYFAWKKWGAPWWVLLISSSAGLTLAFYRLYKVSQKN